ncbi:GNAT family N-acetyltransferase [Pseudoxanthomonas sp. CF125]|uniref:GNAT family N-acetyltransferase n=1 Tax=Pseudoxanthomonas sp. CF125 TaxID=1855303 RepID=UPI000882BA4C|nr:GNAT family N-acetyltransferase [Pseudoxanthomonas sp. CF125]SDQ42013.1 Acetyltransferase (GNAT) family protein [Pseudoxanthomonas sp. CF125]
MTTIRKSTLADVPAIVAMSAKFYETTSYAKWANFNPATVDILASDLTENHLMLLAEHEGKVVGMVGLFVAPFMFNKDKIGAYEVVWWVDPDAQGNGAGKALLAAIEPACKERGVSAIQMVHLASSPPQAAMIYERMGYAHTESSYTRIV